MPRPPAKPGYWSVPKLWAGAECFILGGGPSLKNVDVSRLKDSRVIAVNNSYKLGAWDVLFFGDCRWHEWHKEALLEWAGLKVTTCHRLIGRPGILVVEKRSHPMGFSSDPNKLTWNLSSGVCAMGLAAHLGVKRMVLLGFDMKWTLTCKACGLPKPQGAACECGEKQSQEYRTNWHRDHPTQHVHGKYNPYPRFLRPIPNIVKNAAQRGIEIINATPGSGMTHFPIVDPETVLPC